MTQATAQQLQIIKEILSGKIHYSESVLNLIDTSFTTGVKIAAEGLLIGGIAGAKAGGLGAGVVSGAVLGGIGSAAVGGVVISAVLGIAYAAYYAKGVYDDKQRWYREVDFVGFTAMSCIWTDFFKEEISEAREGWSYVVVDRKHELFHSWMKLQDLYLTPTNERTEEYSEIEKKYNKRIEKYIKPEHIQNGEFEKNMRLYCAANKILKDAGKGQDGPRSDGLYLSGDVRADYDYAGEFQRSKPSRHSKNCNEREGMKLQLQSLMKQEFLEKHTNILDDIDATSNYVFSGFKDENKKSTRTVAFEEVRDQFYRTYKAMTYAFYQGIDFKEIEEKILKPWNQFLDTVVSQENKKLFESIFRKYRWLGGSCEFDAEELMKMKLFDSYYKVILSDEKQERINDPKKYAKYLVKIALLTAGVTIVVGGTFGLIRGVNALRAENIASQNLLIEQTHQNFQELVNNGADISQLREAGGLADLASTGDQVAQQKLTAVQEFLKNATIWTDVSDGNGISCIAQEINFVGSQDVGKNLVLRTYTLKTHGNFLIRAMHLTEMNFMKV